MMKNDGIILSSNGYLRIKYRCQVQVSEIFTVSYFCYTYIAETRTVNENNNLFGAN